ncbi:MAG TPA: 2,3-bisphosphoglycerate-independent phosphoglycerate mutase, partial [Acidimicrobiaceae bacterium]|nr:2,3-bisphosphoglycerate-independent phosphoglycerate mutase [Acidimicrobiaceae bacterium]
AGLLQYDGDLHVPSHYLVEPPTIDHTMGEYLAAEGMSCFAISETQKFGHVTFFWNGNRS